MKRDGSPDSGSQVARTAGGRRGISLMEVILATALLMGSVVVLSRLIGMGRTQANKAEFASEAQRLCENTMHEIMLGLRPMESIEEAPLRPIPVAGFGGLEDRDDGDVFTGMVDESASEANPRWLYSVRIGTVLDSTELAGLTVMVSQAESTLRRPMQFQLSRWVRFDTMPSDDSTGDLFSEAEGFR